ncbi:MAG: hypothetical protein WC521_06110 [Bdellovibrionales bacterium]|jgi:hypothetical protein
MKITTGASSIVSLVCFFLLAGCDSIYVPNFFGHDEVPDEVKEQPRFVEIPTAPEDEKSWPRLGDVPFKPKDFSSPSATNNSMNELAQDRFDSEAEKNRILYENAPSSNAAPQDEPGLPTIQPPQFLLNK